MARADVDDPGLNFMPPQRREVQRFEPPPWEREAFEELQRRRAQSTSQEEAGQGDGSLEGEDAGPQAETVTAAAGPAAEESDAHQQEPAVTTASQGEAGERTTPLDDRRVLEMMARLAEEEPRLHEQTWRPALVVAMVMAALGVVMMVWGVAAAVRTQAAGPVGFVGAFVLMAFGAGFVAIAVWIAVRTLRQRGVL